MKDRDRAIVALVFHAMVWILATPGLDFLGINDYRTPASQAALIEDIGRVPAEIAFGLASFNRNVRRPLADMLAPLQRPFRISQEWSLYRDGPPQYRLFEVWVDGELYFRTADPNHAWLAPQLRNRRIRAMVESTAQKKDSPNWRGLSRYIVNAARRDFPDASLVEMKAMVGAFPGTSVQLSHTITAKAPQWRPVLK